MKFNKSGDNFLDLITQQWVKMTGVRFDPKEHPWLPGPIGSKDIIKDKFFNDLAIKENLEIRVNEANSGLLETFDDLDLHDSEKKLLHPSVIDFYEKTSNYDFEVWSGWNGIFKPFGWLLSIMFSKRLQQLNLPLSSLHLAKGINSSIVKLVDKENQKSRWTVWYRLLKSTNGVIYSGVYTTCRIPNMEGKHLKVVFPLPNGNATVVMRREVLSNGALKLSSDGKRFGDNGFYFTLTNHKGKYWARFVRSMHEWITVYVDHENILRADHELQFMGLNFLSLHYKIIRKDYTSKFISNITTTSDYQ